MDSAEAEEVARGLTYTQRKALRRRGRGGSITRTMASDPLISQLSDYSRLSKPPTGPDPFDWFDWEERAYRVHPGLNADGRAVLAALDRSAGD